MERLRAENSRLKEQIVKLLAENERLKQLVLGFTVVAGEVRKLAEQTKDSVGGVSGLIQKTRNQIHTNVQSIQQVESLVKESTVTLQDTIQGFEEILEAMSSTKDQNRKIEHELASFQHVFHEVADVSKTIAASTDQLIEVTDKL